MQGTFPKMEHRYILGINLIHKSPLEQNVLGVVVGCPMQVKYYRHDHLYPLCFCFNLNFHLLAPATITFWASIF